MSFFTARCKIEEKDYKTFFQKYLHIVLVYKLILISLSKAIKRDVLPFKVEIKGRLAIQ